MPLTEFQEELAKLLSGNRSDDSYLAGGAAIHFEPNSIRYSNDLDYFHDSEKRVAEAFEKDRALLGKNSFKIEIEMNQPGYIRCLVSKKKLSTKVEWAHDSAWRFMPNIKCERLGFRMHPVDLAVNKVLALAGRDEPRDFLDIHFIHEKTLSLTSLCWAAPSKDPGFSPYSLLELLKRRGKYRAEDFARLHLCKEVDLVELKKKWLEMLERTECELKKRNPEHVGCLYYSFESQNFENPENCENHDELVPHFGREGGVFPQIRE